MRIRGRRKECHPSKGSPPSRIFVTKYRRGLKSCQAQRGSQIFLETCRLPRVLLSTVASSIISLEFHVRSQTGQWSWGSSAPGPLEAIIFLVSCILATFSLNRISDFSWICVCLLLHHHDSEVWGAPGMRHLASSVHTLKAQCAC